ncbi:MAG: phytochelatin synthase family protein [Victivallaceae bacterium]|nr:phytochelatin synthase family protein [Victivallaceae bacterium]
MKLFRFIIKPYLYLLYFFHKITGTGTFGSEVAEYVDNNSLEGSALKKALHKNHVKQYHEASCSVASVVSVINAINDTENSLTDPPLTQLEILEQVRTGNWKERMSPDGDNGKRGIPLAMLGDIVKSSLDAYNIEYELVETVQAVKSYKQAAAIKENLRERLNDFEQHGNCVIIAHFNQGIFIRDLHIPHISPVGGFDNTTDIVTMLDVDPPHERPYRISFETFYKGISSNYHYIFKPFGFTGGGYIFIKLT